MFCKTVKHVKLDYKMPSIILNLLSFAGLLFYERNSTLFIVGTLALQQDNCQPYIPSVFINLEKYLVWITIQRGIIKSYNETGKNVKK